jgi:hypothetical protein
MRKTPTVLLLATATLFPLHSKDTSGAAQLSHAIRIQNEPGKIETFLLSTPAFLSIPKCSALCRLPKTVWPDSVPSWLTTRLQKRS